MNKQIVGRVQHKHDTEANWLKATNFIPLDGELIIYDPDDNNNSPRFKVGDGNTVVSELPFTQSEASIDGDYAYFDLDAETSDGSAATIDAASLGGLPADNYATLNVLESEYVKASVANVITDDGAVKPQDPISVKGYNIYPLTIYDQIIMPDGSRWNGESAPSIGSGLQFDEEGRVSIKVGSGLQIAEDGTISLALANGDEVSY